MPGAGQGAELYGAEPEGAGAGARSGSQLEGEAGT